MDKSQTFIKIDEYKGMMDILNLAREKLKEVESLFSQIQELKMQEERIFEEWKSELGNVKRRVDDISKNLPQPEVGYG